MSSLRNTRPSTTLPGSFLFRRPDCSCYPTHSTCYADDLQCFAFISQMQCTVDFVSVISMIFNFKIATRKLRAFHYGGVYQPLDDTEFLQIHYRFPKRSRSTPRAPVKANEPQRFHLSLQTMKQKLIVTIHALFIKRASPRAVYPVMARCFYARGVYVGVLSLSSQGPTAQIKLYESHPLG